MAKAKEVTQETQFDKIKKTKITADLIGTGELILNKKCRSYELPEIWKQTHPKGSEMPASLRQGFNLWEHLITSLHWRDPIIFHDDDWSLYTEEELKYYLENNAPCIKSYALIGSMKEAFISLGYKDSTGKNGSDITRAVSATAEKFPITFAEAHYEQKLIPTAGKSKTNVVGQYNVFSGWKTTVELVCANVVLPKETLVSLLIATGEFIGIGTQRKNGYGHFTVDNVRCTEI